MINELKRILFDFFFFIIRGDLLRSTRALALKDAENDYVLPLPLTRIKLAVKHQGRLGINALILNNRK